MRMPKAGTWGNWECNHEGKKSWNLLTQTNDGEEGEDDGDNDDEKYDEKYDEKEGADDDDHDEYEMRRMMSTMMGRMTMMRMN